LFEESAHLLFSDFNASDAASAEAVAWTRVEDLFRATINRFANKKRRKRAQLAHLTSLTVFSRVLRATGLKGRWLRTMARWDSDPYFMERFLEKSCKAVVSALLRFSARQKKNEPAFYKAVESVKPAVDSAVRRVRRKIRRYYWYFLGN